MRTDCPILFLSDHTPPWVAPGLSLRGSPTHGGPGGGATWIHGALVLEGAERTVEHQTHWLRALNVILVEEGDSEPYAAPLLAGDPPLQCRMIEAHLEGGAAVAVLPFSFDLAALLGRHLGRGAYHVHVSAREHAARPLRLVRDEGRASHLVEIAGTALHPAADHLVAAYDAGAGGRHREAVERFSLAFADEEIRGDLSRPHLFNAAEAAGRAALQAGSDEARALLARAVSWLAADGAARGDLLLRIQDALASAGDDQRAALSAARARLLGEMDLLRTSPPS